MKNSKETICKNGKNYYKVFAEEDISEGRAKRVIFPDDQDLELAIFKFEGEYHALSNICPHRHANSIHEGIIKNGNVTCPLHGWTYNIRTGQNIDLSQGLKNLNKYEIIIQDGFIYVEKPGVEAIPKWRRDTFELKEETDD